MVVVDDKLLTQRSQTHRTLAVLRYPECFTLFLCDSVSRRQLIGSCLCLTTPLAAHARVSFLPPHWFVVALANGNGFYLVSC
jgi:hypothetical protein